MKYQLLLRDMFKYTERARLADEMEALRQAMHVMQVVPKAANDMMDVGRLQGFDVSVTKLIVLTYLYIYIYTLRVFAIYISKKLRSLENSKSYVISLINQYYQMLDFFPDFTNEILLNKEKTNFGLNYVFDNNVFDDNVFL